jgi:phenylacetate-CoA ligase
VREIVKYAYEHVPFYHEKLRQNGLKPEDIKTVEDLNKLPITRREELQRNSDKLISNKFDVKKLKVVSTSGSSGKPLFTYLTRKEEEFRHAKLLRPHIICGQKPRDKWVLLGPPQHIKKLNWIQKVFGLYAPHFVSIFEPVPTQLSKIKLLNPDVLDGYSTSLYLLAQEHEKEGGNIIKPKFLMGGAELLDNPSRRQIEETFNAPYYDQYASEELQMIAWQCPQKNGYHVDADTVILQVVDRNGFEVGRGETGEIVCTSLFNYAMPFLRIALDDVGVSAKNDDCPCGIKFPLIQLIAGRKDSVITLPGGRKTHALVFGWIMEYYKFYRNILQYRIIQSRIDSIKVLIKKKDGKCDETEMKNELIVHMRKMLGVSDDELSIEVEFVEEMPLDKSGKFRKIISEVK